MAGPEQRSPIQAFDLTGKVALVTGASRGIGRELALTLAGAGADVAVLSRSLEGCQAVAAAIRGLGRRAVAVAADLTRPAECARAVAEAAALGPLDILVNNAGIAVDGWALEVTEAQWDQVLDTNLKAVFFTSQAAARQMSARGGRIVNIASVYAAGGGKAVAAYAASKAGVTALTRALSLEWGRYGITVNALAPGYVPTEMNAHRFADAGFRRRLQQRSTLGRLQEAGDLAGALLLLSSAAGAFITGQTLYVDGGWTVQ